MPHIQIPPITPRVQYTCNGVQTIYLYNFPIFTDDDLSVQLNGAPQYAGFSITGAGSTEGGTVVFTTPPSNGVILTLARRLDIARTSDFIEGSSFAASTLNTELDYHIAAVQQVAADQAPMLRYPADETSPAVTLPSRATRANKVLGFNGDGIPITYPTTATIGATPFTVPGTGAVSRTIQDRLSEMVSVKDFGAAGDGITDDTLAMQHALAAHQKVFVPSGIYLISNTLTVGERQSLYGQGNTSIIRASTAAFDIIQMPSQYAHLHDLRLENGLAGIRLFGNATPCVENSVRDITIWDAQYGMVLDGYSSGSKPCYWNHFYRVLVARPKIHGVWLTQTGAGDTPNANKFHGVRVYSLSAAMTGSGFYIEYGRYNNSFIDCEANLSNSAQACFHIGPHTEKNLFINPYAESRTSMPNFWLEAGSLDTCIINLLSASAGAAIYDQSGGQYTAYNSGYPFKNRLGKTRVSDFTVEQFRYDTTYYSVAGASTLNIDQTCSCYLVSAFGGQVNAVLPNSHDANGAVITIKKTDTSTNQIVITGSGGNGPDNRTVYLASQYDYVTVISNGGNWWITAANLNPLNTQFVSGVSLYEPDLTRALYYVSAYTGACEVRLPIANASNAVGRTVTIKKSDVSGNAVNVTQSGGGGPDGAALALTSQYKSVTVLSNGAGWLVVSKT